MSIDISDQFTKEGIAKLKKGMILRFLKEGLYNELKITYINKNTSKVRAIFVKTYHPDEVDIVEKKR